MSSPLNAGAALFHTQPDREAFGSSSDDAFASVDPPAPLPVPAVVRRLVPGVSRLQTAPPPPPLEVELHASTAPVPAPELGGTDSDTRHLPALMDPAVLALGFGIHGPASTPLGGRSRDDQREGDCDDAADDAVTALTQALIDATLPTVNTCFAYLKLPEYSARSVLERQLLLAITEGQACFALS
jgi:hypothetical protein